MDGSWPPPKLSERGFPRTRITKKVCDWGRGPVSVGAFFFLDEIPPLFCVFQQFLRCVAGATVQSGYLFSAIVEEQLFDRFLFQLQSVFRGLVFLHGAFSLSHLDVNVVCTGTVLLHILSGRLCIQTR